MRWSAAVAALAGATTALALLPLGTATRGARHHSRIVALQAPTQAGFAKLPLGFEVNRGQSDSRVDFLARGSGYAVFLTRCDAVLALHHSSARFDLRLVGGDRAAHVQAEDRLPGEVNYMIGADPSRWHTRIPTYAEVRYQRVYPGIDLVYHGDQRRLEYDFVVRPGANPRAIALHFGGADRVRLTARGDLLLGLGGGTVRLGKPLAYQEWGGVRRPVAVGYVLGRSHEVGLRLGAYDPRRPLVIDPVLTYSTYLGGSGDDAGFGVAVDGAGNTYVTGQTSSSDFPAIGPHPPLAGDFDVFVAKLNATGSALLYTSVLGGSGLDRGFGIALDPARDAYVAGDTYSGNFPTTAGALQPSSGGDEDAVVAKLDSTGALVYSTYLGGAGPDNGLAIAVDAAGFAYVTGGTASAAFPTTAGALQTAHTGTENAFVAKLDPTGSPLAYSTYLGGGGDAGLGIAVDAAGDAYVGGETGSSDFPTTSGAFQTAFGGGANDAFATKLNATGSSLLYSTYLGGSDFDRAFGLAVDGAGSAYLTGVTFSTDFPTAAAFQPAAGNPFDAFVTKLDANGGALSYSSYLGGSGVEEGFAIAVDSGTSPSAYVAGVSESSDFPTTAGAFQPTLAGPSDAFVTKVGAVSTRVYYLHGSGTTRTLDTSAPTATTAAYADSASVSFGGGNPWKAVGTWSAAPAASTETLTGLSNLHAWLGLKNSDDQGTQFDLRAEVAKNGAVVGSSITRCITGVTRNPDLAKEVSAAFDAFAPVPVAAGDVLSLKLSTRIGTNPDGSKCPGHSSAVGLRTYFDSVSRSARFAATFGA